MNKWSFGTSIVVCAMISSVACKKSDTAANDAGADAGALVVTNPNDATRYPYETSLANVPSTVVRDTGTTVRKSPPNGGTIATLAKGAALIELAQANHAYLVTFTDPADSKLKMGWVNDDAFTNDSPPDASAEWQGHGHPGIGHDGGTPTAGGNSLPVAPANTAGQIMIPPVGGSCPSGFVKGSHDPSCHKSCATTHDCPAGSCKNKICTI